MSITIRALIIFILFAALWPYGAHAEETEKSEQRSDGWAGGDRGAPNGRTRQITCDGHDTIERELRKLNPGDTLLISGTCNENIVIEEQLSNITLDGQGSAVINGPDPQRATVLVRARGVTLQRLTVTGGQSGVQISMGGAATIRNNTVRFTGADGVLVNQEGSARILDNLIENNPGFGILINENSSARVGFASGDDTVASPNTIQNNGEGGINVNRSSQARIVGNIISNNIDNGVQINRASHADVASNTIDANSGDGVFVTRNSAVNLGDDAGSGIFSSPNTTHIDNGGFGIRCRINSSADGRRGGLSGANGLSSFDTSTGTPNGGCVNSTNP